MSRTLVYPTRPPRGRCRVCGAERPLRRHTRLGWVLRLHKARPADREPCPGSAQEPTEPAEAAGGDR